MTADANEYVIVGKIGAAYGIQGWLKITSFTDTLADILDYDPWYVEDNLGWKLMDVESGKPHGKGLVVKLKGLANPEEARLLTGKKIAIKRSQLPELPKNEFYWRDLEGLTVINHNGDILGKIVYIMSTGSNDVLVVKGEKEHAIPYLPDDVITSIDLDKKIMHVKWDLI